MQNSGTSDLINFAKIKVFLKDFNTDTLTASDIANFETKYDAQISLEWDIDNHYYGNIGTIIYLH